MLSAALVLLGNLCLVAVQHLPIERIAGVEVNVLVLTAMIAASERWAFYVQVRREAQSISINSIPAVLALFYCSPSELVTAKLLGMGLVLVLHRRQTLLKLIFNLSLALASASVMLLVFHLLAGPTTADSPRNWVATLLAVMASDLVDSLALRRVISWYDGELAPFWRDAGMTAAVGAVGSTLGIIAVIVLRLGPQAILPLLAAGAGLLLFYRAYASLAERHTSLERLFGFSRELTGAPATEEALPAILGQARELLQAERAEILLFRSFDSHEGLAVWAFDDRGLHALPEQQARDALASLPHDLEDEARLVTAAQLGDRAFLQLREADEAVIAPLAVNGTTVGHLAVYDRLGEVRGFEKTDVTLLQTVANHSSVALHNESLIGRLRHDARHDGLTGLPNRAALLASATAAVSRAAAGKTRVAMMIIDLNGFKAVNDTLGHHVGDALICEVADRFRVAAGEGSIVARLGGDEFAVLVEPALDDGHAVAERLTESLDAPMLFDGERLHLSASIGIAVAPDHATSVSDLLKRADIAMYAAKNGSDSAIVYRADIDGSDAGLLSLMGELRAAIINGEIGIEVEPLVDLATGELHSVEALVRWHHPRHGKLPPAVFLPPAERNGLIVPLTERVLNDAISACADWHRQGLVVGVSVNLSARSLLDDQLPQRVASLLAEHSLPAQYLTLEITESIVITDAERTIALLEELSTLGVLLSLDDFGTGYSSLTYLSRLPIQMLKIDRSFVERIVESPRDAAIVASMVELAHHLGLKVVAEGIEEPRVRERLRRQRCDYGQGFLFAQSMNPADLPDWDRRLVASMAAAPGLHSAVSPAATH